MSDFQLEDTLFFRFTTRAFATGIPTVLAGTPAIDIYEDDSTTQVIVGETLTVDFDGVVGLNLITITATAASGFEAGKSYCCIIEAGTVGGVSVVGEVVKEFTLDMSAAAKDLANGTDGLGAIKTEVDKVVTAVITNAAGVDIAADIIVIEGQTDDIGVAGAGLTAINLPNQTMDITGDITGNLSGSVGSVTAINTTGGAIDDVVLVATTTTNSDMRGTDSAALASVLGALADAAADGDPTTGDTLMQYVKQLINILIGTTGIVAWPASADPGNGVSLSEAIRQIFDDTDANTAQTGDSFARLGAPAGASVSADIAVIEGQTDDIGVAGAGLTDLGGMSTGMKAEVLVEANAALDTAISELAQTAPTATPTMRTGLMLLYMALRNRLDVDTSGTDELQIFNDAGTVIVKKLLTDDGTIYSEAEAISGP